MMSGTALFVDANNGNATNNSNNVASYPLQLQGGYSNTMMNNGFILSNNGDAAGAGAAILVPTHGPMIDASSSGFPQATGDNTVTVFQVKTGESTSPFLSGQPRRQENEPPRDFGQSGGKCSEQIARSSSEPLLNNMVEVDGTFRMNNDASPPFNQQLGKWGIGNQNSNNFYGLNVRGNGYGNNNNEMGNFSMSVGYGGGGNNNRRRSEPPLNMLSEIFDQSVAAEGGQGSKNLGGWPHAHQRTVDGWSSPPLQDMGPKRSSSVPLDMMFDLDNLEPEKVFDDQITGGSSSHKQLQGKDQSTASQDVPRGRDGNCLTGRRNVKRSHSVDAVETFRRIDDDNNHAARGEHGLYLDGGWEDAHKGLSEGEQQRLESMGIFSREEPKRRRSLPLLNEEMLADMFKQPGLGEGHSNFASGSTLNPAAQPATENPQEKINMSLIDMLLGIENGAINAPTRANNSGSGTSRTSHQMDSMTATSSQPNQISSNDRPLTPVQMPQQQLPQQQLRTTNEPMPQAFNQHMMQAPMNQSVRMGTNMQSHQQRQLLSNSSMRGQIAFMPHRQQLMINHDTVVNQVMSNNQQIGKSLAAPAPTNNNPSQAPPSLSIGNSEDLNLVLSAVKETQTNLRTLQTLVMQQGDASTMEDLAAAFKITASSSQFVLASDLPSAYSTLNDAWEKIKNLEDRLAQAQELQSRGRPLSNNMGNNYSSFQGMAIFPQRALQDQVYGPVDPIKNEEIPQPVGMSNPLQNVLLSNNTYIPVQGKKKKRETRSSSDYEPITPVSGRKPMADVQRLRAPPLTPKGKSKASKKESPPPSPEVKVVELEDLPPQDKDNPEVIMSRLKGLMGRTQMSQKRLQRWDKKNGLPKSHSQTMVNSSRSRKQLQKGVILKKWNGDPLITPAEDGEGTKSGEQTGPYQENRDPLTASADRDGAKYEEGTGSSQEKTEAQPKETSSSLEEQSERISSFQEGSEMRPDKTSSFPEEPKKNMIDTQTGRDLNDLKNTGGTGSTEIMDDNETPSHSKYSDASLDLSDCR